MTMKNNVLLASCGLLAVTLVACGGESGGSPTQSNSEGIQNGYNSFGNTLTDSRDGQVYRTVTIGEQTWMAENLNYAMDGSYCYDDDPANCAKYGRLYTWSVSKTACPTGWHLPTKDDWWTLFDLVNEAYPDSAKWALLAKGYDHWPKAFDAYGFSALPAGEGGFYGELTRNFGYKWLNHTAFFQISTSSCSVSCDLVCLDDDCAAVFLPNNSPTSALSIRCLKDDEPLPSESKLDSSESNSNVKNGVLNDVRDGKTYKTVKIGDQVWMAENLNFETGSSSCFKDSLEYCEKYGRLYKWTDAMDSAGAYSANGMGCGLKTVCSPKYPMQGICPEGWHIPVSSEWEKLFFSVGASPKALQAKGFGEWKNATDEYGFSALPVIARNKAVFWSATQIDAGGGDYWSLKENDAVFGYGDDGVYSDETVSIRCLKDDGRISGGSNTLIDERDGQIYKTVTIGPLTWMAEDLRYSDSIMKSPDVIKNSDGCLYTWSVAIDSVGAFSSNGKGCGNNTTCKTVGFVRGICPEGWHLPSKTELNTVYSVLGQSIENLLQNGLVGNNDYWVFRYSSIYGSDHEIYSSSFSSSLWGGWDDSFNAVRCVKD